MPSFITAGNQRDILKARLLLLTTVFLFCVQVVQKELDERLKVVQPSYRVLQPMLGVRRVVLSLAKDIDCQIQSLFTTEIGNSWLKSIEIARK